MTIQRNIGEAKTQLSQLVKAAIAGETVVIAKGGKPAVRLVPVEEPAPRKLGSLPPLDLPDELFDPLPPEELAHWQ